MKKISLLLLIIIFSSSVFATYDPSLTLSTGLLGLGILNPSEKLQVNGSLRIDNSSGSSLFYVNSTSGNIQVTKTIIASNFNGSWNGSGNYYLTTNPAGYYNGSTTSITLSTNLTVGSVGNEAGGVSINGTSTGIQSYIIDTANLTTPELLILKHSTVNPPRIISARSNNDTIGSKSVTAGQSLLDIIGAGVGNNSAISYFYFAKISFLADTGWNITNQSAPGMLAFYTTPNSSITPVMRMNITSQGNINVANNITANQFNGNWNGSVNYLQNSSSAKFTTLNITTSFQLPNITTGACTGGYMAYNYSNNRAYICNVTGWRIINWT